MDRHSEPLSLVYAVAWVAILSALILLAFRYGPLVVL